MAKYPITSFINLFNNIIYDKDQNPNPTLDIWDAYVISPLFKDKLSYFITHVIKEGDTWNSLAGYYYDNDRLWWIIPLFNDVENPFLIFDRDLYSNETKELKILKPNYINQITLLARQQKILNDRQIDRNSNA